MGVIYWNLPFLYPIVYMLGKLTDIWLKLFCLWDVQGDFSMGSPSFQKSYPKIFSFTQALN